MRIGIFTDTYLPYVSGLVTSELMLKNALESLGHEVFIVTANLENFKFIKDGNVLKIYFDIYFGNIFLDLSSKAK